MTSTC